jgi:hypothetical protein
MRILVSLIGVKDDCFKVSLTLAYDDMIVSEEANFLSNLVDIYHELGRSEANFCLICFLFVFPTNSLIDWILRAMTYKAVFFPHLLILI